MDWHTSLDFRKCFSKLPREAKRDAMDCYKQWQKDPFANALHFKCIDQKKNIWSVRAGISWRAFGVRDGDEMTWFWIGSHEEASGLIKNVARKNTDNIKAKP